MITWFRSASLFQWLAEGEGHSKGKKKSCGLSNLTSIPCIISPPQKHIGEGPTGGTLCLLQYCWKGGRQADGMQRITERWVESQKGTTSTCCSPCNTPVTFPDRAGSATDWPSRREDIFWGGTRRATPQSNIELSQCSSNPWGGREIKTTRTWQSSAATLASRLYSVWLRQFALKQQDTTFPLPRKRNHIYVQVEESDPFLQSVQCWAYKLFTSYLLQKKIEKHIPNQNMLQKRK